MDVKFFTMQPFTVNVLGMMPSLTKRQEAAITISRIAKFAFLGIGALFTLYGAFYLLRRHFFRNLINNNSLQTPQLSNSTFTFEDRETLFEKMPENILNIVKELKSIDELKSIQFCIIFCSSGKTLQLPTKNISSESSEDLRKMFILAIEESVVNAKNNGIPSKWDAIKWSVIAQDHHDVLHGGIYHLIFPQSQTTFPQNQFKITATKSFLHNVDLGKKSNLEEIVSKKLSG